MGVELTGEEVGGEEENKSEVREKDGTKLKRKIGEKQIMEELVHEYTSTLLHPAWQLRQISTPEILHIHLAGGPI